MRVIGCCRMWSCVNYYAFLYEPILMLVDEWYFDYCSQSRNKGGNLLEVLIDTDGAEGIAASSHLSCVMIHGHLHLQCGVTWKANYVNRLSDVTVSNNARSSYLYPKTQEQMDTQFWQFVTDIPEKKE